MKNRTLLKDCTHGIRNFTDLIEELQREIDSKESEIDEFEEKVNDLEKQIEELKDKLSNFEQLSKCEFYTCT